MNFTARTSFIAIALASLTTPAVAQQVPPSTSPTPDAATTNAPASDDADVNGQQSPTAAAATPSRSDAPASSSDIIVTGSRVPRAVDRIAGAVTVIGGAEVGRTLAITEDATAVLARSVPGYSESNQTLNTLGETLRGRTALYLFDGVPQSTPLRDGNRNATFTDMATIGRIEVISGASASEGIGAAGGIINYISKRPTEEGTHIGVEGRLGTQFRDDSQDYKAGVTLSHKSGNVDAFFSGSFLDRGITYDANGRRIGLSPSSSVADTRSKSLFGKVGYNFGDGDNQRIELTANYFRIESKGNYHYVKGDRTRGIPDTSEPGLLRDASGNLLYSQDFNDFKQIAATYTNKDVFGGSFIATAYGAKQKMRFPGDNLIERQDPRIKPIGTLFDQSQIGSDKYGLRTSFSRPNLFIDGLELRVGIDLTHDETEQRQALTNRTYVPPLNYTSAAPYAQLSWDIGPVTLSGGYRHEDGAVKVDDYTTLYFYNSSQVKGGKVKYVNDLFNGGIVTRFGKGFSAYATYGEGFTLPNVGTVVRSVNRPGQTIDSLFGDLQAIVFKNKEVGLNWRQPIGNFSFSYYQSDSALGSSPAVDPVTRTITVNRRPIRINGIDVAAEFRPTSTLRLNALFAHTVGKTSRANFVTDPLDVRLGVLTISPDKLNGSVTWTPTEKTSFSIGGQKFFDRDINIGKSTEEHTKGYTIFDATASYKVDRIGQFSLGVENLFNKQYFLSISQIDIYNNYFAGRGRTVSLTYRGSF